MLKEISRFFSEYTAALTGIGAEQRQRELQIRDLEKVASGRVGVADRIAYMDQKAENARTPEETLSSYRHTNDFEVIKAARRKLRLIKNGMKVVK